MDGGRQMTSEFAFIVARLSTSWLGYRTTVLLGKLDMFYTYLWRDADGVPFYVGKGTGARAQNTSMRSKAFKAEHVKGGCTVEIVEEFALEADAYAHEVELIQQYGRRKFGGLLVNNLDGGNGRTGYTVTEETRSRMRRAQRIRRSRRSKFRPWSGRMMESIRMSGPRGNNLTGFKGVSLHAPGKWVAKIADDGKSRYIGLYNSPEDAARAYDAAAVKAWGMGNAYLNFPEDYRDAA